MAELLPPHMGKEKKSESWQTLNFKIISAGCPEINPMFPRDAPLFPFLMVIPVLILKGPLRTIPLGYLIFALHPG